METKNYGKSIRARLFNLSKQENISYQLILIRYIQERLLYRLSQSDFKNSFFLKGGALLYAYEQFKARPTLEDDVFQYTKDAIQITNIKDGRGDMNMQMIV